MTFGQPSKYSELLYLTFSLESDLHYDHGVGGHEIARKVWFWVSQEITSSINILGH